MLSSAEASGFGDVSLLDEEIVDLASLVDVDLDQSPGLRQPQSALPSALAQQGLLVLQVGPRNQPHHLAQLHTHTETHPADGELFPLEA